MANTEDGVPILCGDDSFSSGDIHTQNKKEKSPKFYSSEPHKYSSSTSSEQYRSHSSEEVSDFVRILQALTDGHIRTTERTQTEPKELISFFSIDHDPYLQTESEILAIGKNNILQKNNTQKNILTLRQLEKVLIAQPKRLHLTFHGEHDSNTNRSVIKLDHIRILPQLLTSNETFLYKGRTRKYFRDYVAAISRIFEQEMLTFLKQPINEKRQIYAKCTLIGTDGIFECGAENSSRRRIGGRVKLKKLLQNIAEQRFGCSFVEYIDRKCIGIWYGKWTHDQKTKEWKIESMPNCKWLLNEYMLSSICSNRQIDGIVRQILSKYKEIGQQNKKFVRQLDANYQKYCWTIMNAAMQRVIPQQVWQWLDSDIDFEHTQNENNDFGELYDSFSRTFELSVSPKRTAEDVAAMQKDLKKTVPKLKRSKIEQTILEQRIRSILEDILRTIRQHAVISKGREYESGWLPAPFINIKILRFRNLALCHCVRTQIVSKFQRKYRNEYDITFRSLRCASIGAYLLCGYIPFTDQKKYILDLKSGKDKISKTIRRTLKSKSECNIELLLLMGCHSYKLAQIFSPFIECIVCVHPHTEIDDRICIKFSRHFYKQLEEVKGSVKKDKYKFKYIVMKAFEETIKILNKSYSIRTPCQFHCNKSNHSNKGMVKDLSLMIVQIDRMTHESLKKYVNDRMFAATNQKEQNALLMNVGNERLKCKRKNGKKRQNFYDHFEEDAVFPIHWKCMNPSVPSRGNNRGGQMRKQYEYSPRHSLKESVCSDTGDRISWEWFENATSPQFSYSIIECETKKQKKKIEDLLKKKQKEEGTRMNKEIKNGLMSNNEEDDVNLRWDVTNISQCNCTINVPHRIKDELILLVNGKQIGRDLKLESNGKKVRRNSLPNIKYNECE